MVSGPRNALVVGELLVVRVSRNVVGLFVRWIMWWDGLAVLIVIIIPLVACSVGLSCGDGKRTQAR